MWDEVKKKGRGTSTCSPRSRLLAVHLSVEWRRRRRLRHACAAEFGCVWEDFIKTPPPRRSLTAVRRNARLSRRSFKSDYARLFQLGVRKEAPSSSSINRVVASGGRQNESSSKMTNNTAEIYFLSPTSSLFCFSSCFSKKRGTILGEK